MFSLRRAILIGSVRARDLMNDSTSGKMMMKSLILTSSIKMESNYFATKIMFNLFLKMIGFLIRQDKCKTPNLELIISSEKVEMYLDEEKGNV